MAIFKRKEKKVGYEDELNQMRKTLRKLESERDDAKASLEVMTRAIKKCESYNRDDLKLEFMQEAHAWAQEVKELDAEIDRTIDRLGKLENASKTNAEKKFEAYEVGGLLGMNGLALLLAHNTDVTGGFVNKYTKAVSDKLNNLLRR